MTAQCVLAWLAVTVPIASEEQMVADSTLHNEHCPEQERYASLEFRLRSMTSDAQLQPLETALKASHRYTPVVECRSVRQMKVQAALVHTGLPAYSLRSSRYRPMTTKLWICQVDFGRSPDDTAEAEAPGSGFAIQFARCLAGSSLHGW